MATAYGCLAAAAALFWAGAVAAFDPAGCPTTVRQPTVPEGWVAGEVALAAAPGLFTNDLECHIGPRGDGTPALSVVEYIPNDDGWIIVTYLDQGVVMQMLQPEGIPGAILAQCGFAPPGVLCLADLFVDESVILTLGFADTEEGTQLGLVADLSLMLPDIDPTRVPPENRHLTARLSTLEAPFRFTPLEESEIAFAVRDVEALLTFFRAVLNAPPEARPELEVRLVLLDSETSGTVHSVLQEPGTLHYVIAAAQRIGHAMNEQRLGR